MLFPKAKMYQARIGIMEEPWRVNSISGRFVLKSTWDTITAGQPFTKLATLQFLPHLLFGSALQNGSNGIVLGQ